MKYDSMFILPSPRMSSFKPEIQEELWNLFFKYKKPQENLLYGKIDTKNFHLPHINVLHTDAETYINQGIFLDIENLNATAFDTRIENFVKICWLSEEYLTNRLKWPLGGHYNPRSELNVIHPGGSRSKVIALWEIPSLDMYYFNTGEIQFDWLKDLAVIDKRPGEGFLTLVPDHGSLIPHMHFDQSSLKQNIPKYHLEIRERYNNLRFFCEESSKFQILYRYSVSSPHLSNVRVTFTDSASRLDEFKVLVLLSLGYNAQFENFTIQSDMFTKTLKND